MTKEQKRQAFLEELAELDTLFSQLQPEVELTVRDPEIGLEGYVVVSSTLAARSGPLGYCGKGGTRITPNLTLDEVKMLAGRMTLKNAAAGLPLGGAKSGIRANPDEPGFERKYRRFVSMVKPMLCENGGIFGGFGFDIGARREHPIWACNELGSRRSFTGKPLEMGGTDYDREGIAGLGVATAAATLLQLNSVNASNATFAVQGLGAMGAAVVRYFAELGPKLEFIADTRIGGTFRIPQALRADIVRSIVRQDVDETAMLLESVKPLPLEEVLYQAVDVLFPCAVQDVLTADNCQRVAARYVVEGANNPCTREAASMLFSRQVQRVPDIIANPGGIIAAFVEMTTEDQPGNALAKVDKAKASTREIITANVRKLHFLVTELDVEPADVGRYMAFQQIFGQKECRAKPSF